MKYEEFKRRVAEEYDRESAVYDHTRYCKNTWYIRINEETCDVLRKFLKGKTVLELGAGTGWYGIFCAERGFLWQGIEISKEMVKIAEQKFAKMGFNHLKIILGDVENESLYPEDFFDNVICIKAFNFFPDPEKVAQNVYKCLKNRGRFIIVYSNRDNIYAKIKKLSVYKLMRFYSEQEMNHFLRNFRIIFKRRIISFPGFIYKIPHFANLKVIKLLDNILSLYLPFGAISVVVAEKIV